MSRTTFRSVLVAALLMSASGCGLMQTVGEGARSTARAVFYTQLKTLHLDINGRSAANNDASDMRNLSVPTVVRVYQLRDGKAMERATYEELLSASSTVLGDTLLEERSVVVVPQEGVQLNVPLDPEAQTIAVVALLRQPDTQSRSWRLLLSREQLQSERARVIDLGDNSLSLRAVLEP